MTFKILFSDRDGSFNWTGHVVTYNSIEHGALSNRYHSHDCRVTVLSDTEFIVTPTDVNACAMKFVTIEGE